MSSSSRVWKHVPLGEVCSWVDSCDPRQEAPDETIKYIDISAIDRERKTIVDVKELLGKEAPTRARQVVKTGDVLFSTVRPNLQAVARVPIDLDGEIASTGFCVLRPSKDIDPDYLFYAVIEEGFYHRTIGKVRGIGYPAVRPKDLLAERIPLPPLAIQQAIVAFITRLHGLIEEGLHAFIDAQRRLDGYWHSTVRAVLAGSLATYEEATAKELAAAPLRPLRELADVQYGYTASAKEDPTGPRLLRITDIQDGRVDWNRVPSCEISTKDLDKHRLHARDIVFARMGYTTGKSYLIGEDVPDDAVPASYLVRVRPRAEVVPQFLATYFQGADYWAYIYGEQKGIDRPTLNGRLLKALPVPVPSKYVQRCAADEAWRHGAAITRLRKSLAKRIQEAGVLKRAIVRRALSGELQVDMD